ncbi:MAG TPA: hypothetical protein VKQ72_12115 [Aggregatilineales bacterium]|nr:hypothetical protein [Aggregatilineales bacterium]
MTDKRDSERSESVINANRPSPGFVRWIIIGLVALVSLIIVALVVAILGGISGSEGVAAAFRILRDFFIIVLALQGILISVALIVLVLQLSALINLLRNEIKPLVDEARTTMSTLRGTTQFVSQNLTTPMIKVVSTVAGVRAFLGELAGIRRSTRSRSEQKSRSR